jgi:enoyl-CoA hydratase/carnithine racemase
VVAALHGVCFGGGLQIALGADIRIAAPDTRLSFMEMKWGLVPDMAGFAHARGLLRGDVLRELVYTARMVEAEEARLIGLVTRIAEDPRAEAMALARAIAAQNPDAVRRAKALANMIDDADTPAILQAESHAQAEILARPNQREAVAAGMEKRSPRFED